MCSWFIALHDGEYSSVEYIMRENDGGFPVLDNLCSGLEFTVKNLVIKLNGDSHVIIKHNMKIFDCIIFDIDIQLEAPFHKQCSSMLCFDFSSFMMDVHISPCILSTG